MSIRDIPLDSPINAKIEWAEQCYRTAKDTLLEHSKIIDLIKRLQESVRRSHEEMSAVGIADVCTTCELEGGGSCCGAGLENKYSGILLLINLLCGREISRTRIDPRSCLFLGHRGCTLLARHVICINYLCRRITDRVDVRSLGPLRQLEGDEIDSLFLLNESIKKVLEDH